MGAETAQRLQVSQASTGNLRCFRFQASRSAFGKFPSSPSANVFTSRSRAFGSTCEGHPHRFRNYLWQPCQQLNIIRPRKESHEKIGIKSSHRQGGS
jgi:hypothetical protein